MKRPSRRILAWTCAAIGGAAYMQFGITPPRRLSGVELDMHKRAALIESIARDVKAYMGKHNGNRPVEFSDLIEINAKYSDLGWLNDYRLPTNQVTDILIHEKTDLWKDKTVAIYLNGRYGALLVDEPTFNGLLDGTIGWKDLRMVKKKK